jgi:GT2 family glycosyltransferase
LSIVIVNCNGADWLRRCLGSIRAADDPVSLQVILVDNGSRDGSVEVARELWPDLLALPQKRNIGYVPANNVGLVKADGRYVMFLNNDTELHPGCLSSLVSFLDEHPDVGAASGQILNPDGTDQGTARRLPTIATGLFGRRSLLTRLFPKNRWSRRFMMGRHHRGDEPFEVEILSSACIVLPTELARRLSGMDEDFQLYWVDAELCTRVRAAGFKVYCVPRAKLVHFEGQGGSTRTFRQRVGATLAFHRDAYLAYVKINSLAHVHPLRLFAGLALSVRAACLLLVQVLRPGRATSSGGRN